MPGLKYVIRSKVINSDGKTNIKMRVTHKGVHAHLGTPWYIFPDNLSQDGWIKSNVRGHTAKNSAMIKLMDEYNDVIADIGPDVRNMPLKTLVARLKANEGQGVDFVKYTVNRIKELKKEKRYSSAELYEYTLNAVKIHAEKDLIYFHEIDYSFLKRFEGYLKTNGSSVNTIRNYMCNIRQIFNHAIDVNRSIKQQLYPFREYKIRGEKKKPLALDTRDLKTLLYAQPYLTRAQRRDVDIFFLMFYTGGTNFKDLLFLKHENYYKGRIIYDRFKTRREYSTKVYPEAEEILKKYQGKDYLLNFIEHKIAITPARREAYVNKDLLKNTNKNLKAAGEKCKLPLKLKTYVARYSFSTIAAKLDISKDVIKHILGHGNDMTDSYIDWDQDKNDKAIRQVIDAVINL